MNRRRLLRVFPKIWLDRYGEEFDALLDDLRSERRLDLLACADVVWLGIGASIDVSRLGVMSRLSRRGAKRRLFSFAGVLTLAGGGLGLGLALTAGAAQVSFVVPAPRLAVVNDSIVLSQQSTQELGPAAREAACLLPPDYSPSGTQLLTTNEPEGTAGSVYRAAIASRGRMGSLHWELLGQTGPLARSLTPNARRSAGGLAIADRWYSYCGLLGDDGLGAPGIGLAVVAGGEYDGRHVPGFVYGFVQPSSAKLILTPSSGRSVIPKHIATVAGLDLYLAPLAADPCTFTSLKMLQVSSQRAHSETMDFQPGCHAFSPLETRLVASASGSRTTGTVESVSGGGLVLQTGFWPALDVEIAPTTPVFVEQGPYYSIESYLQQYNAGNDSELGAGSTVYIAGRVTGNHETATGVYLIDD